MVTSMLSRRSFVSGLAAFLAGVSAAGRASAAMSKKMLPAFDLSFLAWPDFRRRCDWTRDKPRPWLLKPIEEYNRLTVHHSGAANNHETKEDIAAYIATMALAHTERGYGDLAYHFVIDSRGGVWEGRSLAYEGAHVAGQNENNIGVVLLGNFEEQEVPKVQLAAAEELIGIIRSHFGIKQHRIYGHCDLGRSLCPGKNLYSYVQKIRNVSSVTMEKMYAVQNTGGARA